MPPKRKSNKQPDAVVIETITVTNNQPTITQPIVMQPAIVQVTNAQQTAPTVEDDKKK